VEPVGTLPRICRKRLILAGARSVTERIMANRQALDVVGEKKVEVEAVVVIAVTCEFSKWV
jgi:hypothetical protein